ncbi:MAG TPA: hypothetical protein EYP40_05910 [Chromatiales bacterium]|nr:hypothetical protein [Chromatiales bacterium]
MKSVAEGKIQIAGAGPSGLAAAITLAQAGVPVVVHESQARVGHRFGCDLQGLENWSHADDVLDELRGYGLETDFEFQAFHEGVAFDAWGEQYNSTSRDPLFYMVIRGPGKGSLDDALYRQACSLGIEVRFQSRLSEIRGKGIWATGPRAADALACGYQFETDMQDGFWVICDNRLAPGGYAYLLVMNGKGTVKSCQFRDFARCRSYADATVRAFRKRAGLRMNNPRWHAGVGNFCMPRCAMRGPHPIAGEQAGFQDTLWGFGIRHAIRTGVLAAQAILGGTDYEQHWRASIGGLMQASVVNRMFYSLLGNYGYRQFLRHQARQTDVRRFLRRYYQLTPVKRLFWPVAHMLIGSKRKDLQTACMLED